MSIVERLRKVKEYNHELLRLNGYWQEHERQNKDFFTHADLAMRMFEIELWFKDTRQDLLAIPDKQANILVDKVVLEYPNEFIEHRYDITSGYIRKIIHDYS